MRPFPRGIHHPCAPHGCSPCRRAHFHADTYHASEAPHDRFR
jgi:hypothetical protein